MQAAPPNKLKKYVLIGVAVVAVISLMMVLLNEVWPPQEQQESHQKESLQVNKLVIQERDSEKKASIKEKRKVVYSTPKVHDQLLIAPSLEGTNIDGAIQADQDNQLILNIGIRDFFDYFLSAVDEIGFEKATQEIERHINQALPEPAKTQANQLLQKYLSFKQTEYQIQQTPIAAGSLNNANAIVIMRESYDALKTSRITLFSEQQNQALFGLEDIYAEHTLSILELMADESLSNEERNQGLQKLEASLPPELSNSFAETRTQSKQAELVQSLVESDLDNAQVHSSLIDQGLSNEQANEVIARRQQQIDFNSTYQTYTTELTKLDQKHANYDASKTRLLQRFFSSPEAVTQARLRDLSVRGSN